MYSRTLDSGSKQFPSIFCNRYMPQCGSDRFRLEINRFVFNCRHSLLELHRSARKTVMINSTPGHVHPFNLNVGNRKSENKIHTWLVFHVSISKSDHILCQKFSCSFSSSSQSERFDKTCLFLLGCLTIIV